MPNEFPKSLLALALSAAFPAVSQAQTAARIDFVSGGVTASTADGRSRPLARGADVMVGETISTQEGRAQMRFSDGALVSLQPQTQFRVDNYVFEGRGTQQESAVMSLLRGGLRTITGLVGKTNRNGYRLQTATATVGPRWAPPRSRAKPPAGTTGRPSRRSRRATRDRATMRPWPGPRRRCPEMRPTPSSPVGATSARRLAPPPVHPPMCSRARQCTTLQGPAGTARTASARPAPVSKAV